MDHTMTMNQGVLTKTKSKEMSPYVKLFLISIVHFIVMYAVMYTMVDRASSIYLNLNNVYMTGMMLAPMVLLMPLTMKMMYPDKKLNAWISIGSIIVFVAFYIFMRSQTFINDKAFVRSMIPHHSGAILMCNEASISDPELKNLCGQIVKSQQDEINQMKQILNRL